jgi:hypothetical protein
MSDAQSDIEAKTGLRRFYDKMPKPASATEEGRARARDYYLALGSFITSFAQVEAAMFYALAWHAKTQRPVATAIFSGTRIDQAASFMRRLAEVNQIDAAEWALLEPVLQQVRLINEIRNAILHYGAKGIYEGRALVADALRALTPEKTKTYLISPEILADLNYDCQKIYRHLIVRHSGRAPLRGEHPALEGVLASAWRYTPAQQAPTRPRADKSPHSRRPDTNQQQSRAPLASRK